MNFQCYVPSASKKKRKNKVLKMMFIMSLLLIFSGVIALGFYSNSKHNKIFKESTFYFVSAFKSKKFKDVEEKQEDVKKLGGAGKIYQKEKLYYMILNVYSDYESAKQVANTNQKIYPEIEILEIKTEKIKKQMQIKIKNNETFFQFYKLSKNSLFEIISFSVGRLSGDLSENSFCSQVLQNKFEFEEITHNVSILEDGDIKNLLNSNTSLMIMYYSAFLNSYFDSDKKNSVICDFVVSLALVYIDFINNL